MGAECFDCKMPYGGIGWIEAIIPDKVWNRIRPEGSAKECGLLCIGCISKRLEVKGFKNVPVFLCGTEHLKAFPGPPNNFMDILRHWDIDPL